MFAKQKKSTFNIRPAILDTQPKRIDNKKICLRVLGRIFPKTKKGLCKNQAFAYNSELEKRALLPLFSFTF